MIPHNAVQVNLCILHKIAEYKPTFIWLFFRYCHFM
nr:MAG TPA: hypothetical protein [Caudoviricetes sp.]